MLKVTAMPMQGKDLKPGDLFSTAGQDYWSHMTPQGIGEKVYIRTDNPDFGDGTALVFRITVQVVEPSSAQVNTPGAGVTVNDALKNALEFIEALGYQAGDVHDELAQVIALLQAHGVDRLRLNLGEERRG